MKTTSHGRRLQNIQGEISQQTLIKSFSNFKLKLRWVNFNVQILKMKMTSNGRLPQKNKSGLSQW